MVSLNETGLVEAEVLARTTATSLDEWMDQVSRDLVGLAPSLPVDPFALAAALACEVRRTVDLERLGETMADLAADTFTISVRSGLPPVNERAVVAHELGHVLLHRLSEGRLSTGTEVEEACDNIAMRILMPSSLLALHIADLGASLDTATTLAHSFRVPLDMMLDRVRQLVSAATLIRGNSKTLLTLDGPLEESGFEDLLAKADTTDGDYFYERFDFAWGGETEWVAELCPLKESGRVQTRLIGMVMPAALYDKGVSADTGAVSARSGRAVMKRYLGRIDAAVVPRIELQLVGTEDG